jgi:hypothetical protein
MGALAAPEETLVHRPGATPHGLVAFVPDYLIGDLDVLDSAAAKPTFVVERINPPPFPAHHRILVRCEAVPIPRLNGAVESRR